MAERKLGKKVKELHDDKGGEYIGRNFNKWCEKNGINCQHMVQATPQQNGVAEHLNRTLAEGVIAMLSQAKLPPSFWGATVLYLTDILNATPSSSVSDTTLYAVWNGTKPNLSMYRIFGCWAHVNILKKDRKNLESHSEPCIFIRFSDGYKGWKVYNPTSRTVSTTRDVIFDETLFPSLSIMSEAATPHIIIGHRDLWADFDDQDNNAAQHPGLPPPPDNNQGAPPQGIPPPPPSKSDPDKPTGNLKEDDTGIKQEEDKEPPIPHGEIPTTPNQKQPAEVETLVKKKKGFVPKTPGSPTPKEESSNEDEGEDDDDEKEDDDDEKEVKDSDEDDEDEEDNEEETTIPPPHFITPASAPAPPPVAPAPSTSTRPVQSMATVKNYHLLAGGQPRKTTQLTPHRQDQGGVQAEDRGGAGKIVPSLMQQDFEDEDPPVDFENALKVTNIVASLLDLYDVEYGEVLPLPAVAEMCLSMVIDNRETVFGAATRPDDTPCNIYEALSSPHAQQWLEAINKEMEAHQANGTWELTQLPEGRKTIGSRWVFIVKRNSDGTIDCYKACLVAQGFTQTPGVDYNQTFSPTTHLSALRTILAKAALNGEFIETINISNTYLNREIEKQHNIFMRQPEEFEQQDTNREKWVCQLKKGLYSLKQSRCLWNHKLTLELECLGFAQIKSDPAVFVMEKDGIRIIMPVFMDDITITSKEQSQVKWVKDSLQKVFKLKDLGPTKFILGIQIDYNQEMCTIAFSQHQYIVDILHHFKMTDCTPVHTPMDPGSGSRLRKYVPNLLKPVDMSTIPYMSAVGALMYLAIDTHPDIMFTVSKLAQYNTNPGPQHWKAVKHVLRYIKGTIDLKLTIRSDGSNPMSSELFKGYSDADHAVDLDTRCSTSGFLIKIGTGTVSWSAKKQQVIADSSTEAEYVSASSAGREILWMCSVTD